MVQFKANRTCCVCRIPNLHYQLHHIDEDPSNNVEENLAVLCLQCHANTQIASAFARKLNAAQVRLYKADWESLVATERKPNSTSALRGSGPVMDLHIRANWVDSFIIGDPSVELYKAISVTITNRSKETKFIESFGFRIDGVDGRTRYAELHPVLALASFKKRMEPGEPQSFSVRLTDLLEGPAHEGLKQGEALCVFVFDTLGSQYFSKWLRYDGGVEEVGD